MTVKFKVVVTTGLLVQLLLSSSVAQDSTPTPNDNRCLTAAHRAFDFWLGDWQVNDASGKPAGRNSIRAVQNGCALHENWTSATSGYTGTSLNFYNRQTKQWQQSWIDSQGGSLDLKGNRVANKMILVSQLIENAQGQKMKHRISWTKNQDGSVRQLWETTTDGQTQIVFDGLYTKVKQ